MKWKQFSVILLLLFTVILFPLTTFAEDDTDPSKKGKMRLKTDRLHDSNQREGLQATELDKVFPDLFRTKTKEKIVTKQEEMEDSIDTIIDFVFQENENHTLLVSADDLFEEHYVATINEIKFEEIEEKTSSISKTTMLVSLLVLIGGMFGTLLLLNKKGVFT